jgi:hypothetical protein
VYKKAARQKCNKSSAEEVIATSRTPSVGDANRFL